MKHFFLAFHILLAVTLFCSPAGDIAVTQTGNPTQVGLLIQADTSSALRKQLRKKATAGISVEQAFIVIHQIEAEPVNGEENIHFGENGPYIVELIPGSNTGIIDSIDITGTNTYESFTMEISPLESMTISENVPETLLMENSILVKGYVGGNPQDTFTFTSRITGSFEFEFDSAVVLPVPLKTNIIITIKTSAWFFDPAGELIDPRDQQNHQRIDDNILNSVSGSEQEEEFEDEDETKDETDTTTSTEEELP